MVEETGLRHQKLQRTDAKTGENENFAGPSKKVGKTDAKVVCIDQTKTLSKYSPVIRARYASLGRTLYPSRWDMFVECDNVGTGSLFSRFEAYATAEQANVSVL